MSSWSTAVLTLNISSLDFTISATCWRIGSIARQWTQPYDMNSTTMGPFPSNTHWLNVALVTVRILALDTTPSEGLWSAAGVSSIVGAPDGLAVKCSLALTGMTLLGTPCSNATCKKQLNRDKQTTSALRPR